MEKGRILFSGPTAELEHRPDLLRAVFFGNGQTAAQPARRPEITVERPPALEVAELAVNFGGIRAVDDVSLRLAHGEMVGMIGPNGAGKSTLFNLISGFISPTSGTATLDGSDVTNVSPEGRARAGLGRTFQDARLFPALKVKETIAVAQERSVAVR